ncbi:MAG: DUF3016 domain-containing protein [Alishewanella sp.]|nr:DUF3016 domain-containing protein [Alishewanella sp.]
MRNSILAMTLLAWSGLSVAAAELTLNFDDPKGFTDVRPTNDTRSRYSERVVAAFTDSFNELAAEMPAGYTWQVTVTDIDLAGDVDYFAGPAGQALRIVKDIHSPAIRFTHQLLDASGQTVLSGEVKERDMGFLQRLGRANSRKEFEFEHKMLEDWFKKTVKPALND